MSILPVYNILSHEDSWMDKETMLSIRDCPCVTEVCKEFDGTCLMI